MLRRTSNVAASDGVVYKPASRTQPGVQRRTAFGPRFASDTSAYAVLVAGYAGSGKTEFSKMVARGLSWPILDKDTTTRPLVDALSERLSGDRNDRQSRTYLQLIRPLEYKALHDVVIENVRQGVSVVATAPYLQELSNPQWVVKARNEFAALDAKLHIVWVDCDQETMLARIRYRGAERDEWKLDNWAEYSASIDAAKYRSVADTVVSNDRDAFAPLQVLADKFIAQLVVPSTSVATARL